MRDPTAEEPAEGIAAAHGSERALAVVALYLMTLMGGTPVGAPLIGWVGQTYGARWMLIGGGLVTGIAVGTVTAMLGAALISLGMGLKARMEEGFLTAELGEDAYGSYCRRVPMLIPFLPRT